PESVGPKPLDQLQRIGHVQRHPAVVGEEEIVAYTLAHLSRRLDVATQALVTLRGAVHEGKLAADEAELPREIGAGAGGVELDLVAHGAADQRVNGLCAQPAEKVPEREIDSGDRIQDEPPPPVE